MKLYKKGLSLTELDDELKSCGINLLVNATEVDYDSFDASESVYFTISARAFVLSSGDDGDKDRYANAMKILENQGV